MLNLKINTDDLEQLEDIIFNKDALTQFMFDEDGLTQFEDCGYCDNCEFASYSEHNIPEKTCRNRDLCKHIAEKVIGSAKYNLRNAVLEAWIHG